MSEKKMISRNVAMALGMICIILVIVLSALVYVAVSLQNQINNQQEILNAKKLMTWVVDKSIYVSGDNSTNIGLFSASYAGYVGVTLLDSTNSSIYTLLVVNWDSEWGATNSISPLIPEVVREGLFVGQTSYFPVLPTDTISISIENDYTNAVNQTVTVIYYY